MYKNENTGFVKHYRRKEGENDKGEESTGNRGCINNA